jgi:hypothetical protein
MRNTRFIALGLSLTMGAGVLVGYSVERARAAGIPATQALTYSGVLTSGSGVPLTGSKNIQISIYNMAAGGTLQCSAGPTAIALASGGFQLALPDTCTTAVHAAPDLWIEVFVDGTSLGRTKLGAVPFAVEADHAKSADSATSATTAATASAAGGALQNGISQIQSAITSLQAQPLTAMVFDSLNTTDSSGSSWQGFATQCIAADTGGGATLIDACLVAATRKCRDGLGYQMGWPTGELASGIVAIACIK